MIARGDADGYGATMLASLFMPDGLPETRDGFRFRGGHAVLDATATVLGRLKATPKDQWQSADDVARWFVAAGLAATTPVTAAGDLAAARALRETLYQLAQARIAGVAPDAALLAELNAQAALPAAVPQIGTDGRVCFAGTLAEFLALLAREAAVLFGSDLGGRLHACEGGGCTVLFLDTSRAGDRRWCSMAACGNRAKVAEFRRRKRAEGEAG